MNNSNGGFGSADSASSFGDHGSRSEDIHVRPHGNTAPAANTAEESKDSGNSSSDTANFFQNSPSASPNGERPANLSFDNDSVMGAAIRLGEHRTSLSGERWEDQEESSYSGHTTSLHDDLTTSQTRSTPTQERLSAGTRRVALFQPAPVVFREAARYLAGGEDDDDSAAAAGTVHPVFEEQVEGILDEMVYLVNAERGKLRDQKTTLAGETRNFADYHRMEKEKLSSEKDQWVANSRKTKELCVSAEEVFRLNIGGTRCVTTTKATLCRAEGSVLAAMFSGRHKLKIINDRVFVDRDAEAFCLMLSYLRNGRTPQMEGKTQENLFYEELEYWQVPTNLGRMVTEERATFDPDWCASTLRLENGNTLVRKHGEMVDRKL